MRIYRVSSHLTLPVLLVPILMVAAAMPGGPAAAQSSVGARIDSVFAEWQTTTSPGCVVGVQRHGEAARFGAYGMADVELGVPLDTASRFAAGSVAKSITALTIGTLIDEGKLSLQSDARRLVPEIAHYPAPITVAQLLTHTSGVRDFRQLLVMGGWRSSDAMLLSDALRVLARQKATSFPPGTQYTYSNSDYLLLAQIAEHLLGKPFVEIARERVFAPLGMNGSMFMEQSGQLVDHRAIGYGHTQRGWRTLAREEAIPGPGDIYTTVPDLLRFLANLDSTRVGSNAFVAALQAPARLADGTPIDVEHSGDGQGLGFALSTFAGRTTVSHDGGVPGFLSNATWIPSERLAVVTLCNTWALDLTALMRGVLGSIIDTTGVGVAAHPAPRRVGGIRPAAPGVYQNEELRYAYRIHADHDSLRIGTHALVKRENGSYGIADSPGNLVAFRTATDGRPMLLLWNGDQTSPEEYTLRLAGNGPDSLTRAELSQYAGRWYSAEVDYTWTFRVDGNRLALVGPKWDADPEFYAPTTRDLFSGESGMIVEFSRDASGKLVGFRATWDRARGIAFRRLVGGEP